MTYYYKHIVVRWLATFDGTKHTKVFAPEGYERAKAGDRLSFEELEAHIENKINDWIDGDYVLKADDLAATMSDEFRAWIVSNSRD